VALLETLSNPPQRSTGGRSVIDIWIDTLNPEDHNAVLTAARNPAWRHTDLLEALIAEGAPRIADTTFGAWRRKVGLPRDSH
jgi:hypothetical protein